MAPNTHYGVLHVPENADAERIRHAFRVLVRRYHPDTGIGSSADKFRAVVNAYGVLSDPQTRRDYDVTLARSRSRNVNVPEPLIPPKPNAETIYAHARHIAADDHFDLFDQMVDGLFAAFNSRFTFRGW
jgi:DnaJ-class molecular chaperone